MTIGRSNRSEGRSEGLQGNTDRHSYSTIACRLAAGSKLTCLRNSKGKEKSTRPKKDRSYMDILRIILLGMLKFVIVDESAVTRL
jgi:hypothetical protein